MSPTTRRLHSVQRARPARATLARTVATMVTGIGKLVTPVLLLATILTACKADGITAAERSPSVLPPETPGQAIVAGLLSSSTRLVWEQGEEIIYTALDFLGVGSQVRRLNIADGRITVIDSLKTRGALHGGLWVTRDGRHVFFLRSGALYHAAGDTAPVLVATALASGSDGPTSPYGGGLLPGDDGRRAVYTTATDSTWLYDATSRTRRFLTTGCRALLVASPDGQQLLCRSANAAFTVVNTSTGALSPSTAPADPTHSVHSIHWGERGIEHIRSGAHFLTELVNGAGTSVITVIAAAQTGVTARLIDFPNLSSLTWSKDGRKVAYSRHLCEGAWTCDRTQSQLFVFDVETRVTTRAAVVNREIGSITFAPDGNRIAYLAFAGGTNSTLYVVPVQ